MKKGLVLGKFMPLHKGHMALVDFALSNCDELVVLLCSHPAEPISGAQRLQWLNETYGDKKIIKIIHCEYDASILSDSSISTHENTLPWANWISENIDGVQVIFSSEVYGELLASLLGIKHICFDIERAAFSFSASDIRNHPFNHWDDLAPAAKPCFVKKICLTGSESTGKTVLTEKLARHYQTNFVPETAREIIGHTNDCSYDDLLKIAALQANTINDRLPSANKLLFCDTGLSTTRSYSRFLFNKELVVDPWIEEANHFDLYLFLETDAPYIQDGTRVSEKDREKLSLSHRRQLELDSNVYSIISGSWDERFRLAVKAVENMLK